MQRTLVDRIEYGRRIRSEADRLIAEHGAGAAEEAARQAGRFGLTAADAAFLAAVADRVARLGTVAPMAEVA
jgi:hypothetical protein